MGVSEPTSARDDAGSKFRSLEKRRGQEAALRALFQRKRGGGSSQGNWEKMVREAGGPPGDDEVRRTTWRRCPPRSQVKTEFEEGGNPLCHSCLEGDKNEVRA